MERGVPVAAHDELPGAFGDALRNCPEESGLSQQELAEDAEIPVKAIKAWERGEDHGPDLRTLQSLAHALDMTTCELVEAGEVD
jgi:transcriptional regulator with XRE-family HTH domain